MSVFARIWAAVALAAALLLGAAGPSAAQSNSLPTTVFGDGAAVTPANAWTFYQTQNLTSPTRAADPDVQRLAKALGTAAKPNGDVDRIYAFVHDDIEMVWLFGLKAGARGAMIDKAGTPFDQTHLMVELLRAAGYPTTYQLGSITLTGAQFTAWTGVSNRNAAIAMLRKGGFPATVSGSGSNITSVTMVHLWARVVIDGTTYSFDPAYKGQTRTEVSGAAIDTASGFSPSTFISRASSGATTSTTSSTPRVRSMNRTNVTTDLQTAATTLETSIATNQPNGDIEDVIGGSDINPLAPGAVRQTSLAYQGTLYTTFANDIPIALRTKATMQFYYNGGASSQTFDWYADEIYGDQIVFSPIVDKGPTEPEQFRVFLGEQDLTGWLTGTIPSPNITVNHPYAARQTGAGAADGTYMDRTVSINAGNVWGSLQIVLGFGRPSTDLGAWQEQRFSSDEGTFVRMYGTGEAEPVTNHDQRATRRRMGAAYLAQLSQAATMVGELGDSVVQQHDAIGFVTSSYIPGYVNTIGAAGTTFHIGIESAVSATALDASDTGTQAALRTYALMVPALEGSLTEQMADSRYTASTPAKFDWAAYSVTGSTGGDNNDWFYWADSNNWNSYVRAKILLDLEGTSPVLNLADNYIAAGFSLIIPRSSDLGPGPEEQTYCTTGVQPPQPDCTIPGPERGGAFIGIGANDSSMAHMMGRPNGVSSKGGGGSSDAEINPGRIFAIPEDFQDRQYTSRAESFNVDVRTGMLSYTPPPDITVGNGAYPYSLAFQRTFRSAPRPYVPMPEVGSPYVPRDPLFGETGWTSNLTHRAQPGSDGMQAFGVDDPRTAASTIVAIRAMLKTSLDEDLSMGTLNGKLTALQRQLIANMSAAWWTRTFLQNTITIEQGPDSRTFVRRASGAWSPPRGRDETLQVQGERQYQEIGGAAPRPGYWTYKYICLKLTGADRSVTYYGPASWTDFVLANCPTLASDGQPESRNKAAQFRGQLFRRQTFPFGVQVDATANGGLSNNLGRSLLVTGGAADPGVASSITVEDGEDTSRVVALSYVGTTYPTEIYGAVNLSVTDPEGHVWGYGGDGFTVSAPSAPAKPFLRFRFVNDVAAVVEAFTDANGNETQYFAGANRAGAVRDPLGNSSYLLYDEHGQPVVNIDRRGEVSTTAYDVHRRVTRVTQPEGNAEEYSYDARHNRTETRLKPKPIGSPPADIVTSATYNAAFNVPATETDALGRVTNYTYDATSGLLLTITQPDPDTSDGDPARPTTTFTWNSLGQRLTRTEPTGIVLRYTYDGENQLDTVTNAYGTGVAATTSFDYDAAGNITTLTDPRSKVYTATWDDMRRITQMTAPASTGAQTQWTYDADGLVSTIRQATGLASPNQWATTTVAYEPTARVRSVTDPDGRVTRFQYDALNRNVLTIDPEGRTAGKTYDADGRVLVERRGDGGPTSATNDVVAYVTRSYTDNGQVATFADANPGVTSYTYDAFDRMVRTSFPASGTGATNAGDYEELTLDVAGNVTARRTRSALSITMTYDRLNRMKTKAVPASGSIPRTGY